MKNGPLAGVRVVELARILAGPWAGQVLSDLGAEVVKIECPSGDDTRQWGPPFIDNGDGTRDAAYFHSTNRGKKSRVIDFRDARENAELQEIIAGADVLIENFKVGGLAKYGLDYESLSKTNPRLIYCSITGFGQFGPYSSRSGYDFIVQGMSGIMDLTGSPGGQPQKIGVAYADILTGLYSVIGIQAALLQRDQTGVGQHIDMALFDVMVGTLANQALNYLASEVNPTRLGNAHPNIVPYEVYPTRDGWLILACGNDAQYERVTQVLQIAADPRFVRNEGRVHHRDEVRDIISAATQIWRRDDLLDAFEKVGVPAGPINTVSQALSDPQIQARAMVIPAPQDDPSQVPGLRLPIVFSGAKLHSTTAVPTLGNDETEAADAWHGPNG
ncbi:CaiB/BaiF CoA transferase family protein [Sphingobium nicotianae]|uniref:CoA transferase n=1 Tax=Sphingobium nicotianae TaxID=2782607 RepID=A0A9X1D9S4_9SPHN|nr:CaiB/BaiF CoA-transferase family protein [Sphingobium nicotianae]MBT2186024.1 CoA transferase [Sphingobium nicotianae]